jgi:two-component system LytT family response regulator
MKISETTQNNQEGASFGLKKARLKLHYCNRFESVPVEKIIRLEGDCNYTVVYTQSKRYVSSRTLKHYEDILDNEMFIRVHKSHIVNLQYMDSVDSEVKFKEGSPIEISRRKLKEVVEKFETYNR